MTDKSPGSWTGRVLAALVVLLLAAAVTRVAYELLVPVLPLVLVAVVLIGLYVIALGLFRR